MAPERVPLVKLMMLLKRKEGVSFEEFDKHWSQVHGPLFASLPIVRAKLVKYVQVHMDKASMEDVTVASGLSFYTHYDGVLYAYAKKAKDLTDIMEDEDYKTIIVPDENKFVDMEASKMFICYDEVHWDQNDPQFSFLRSKPIALFRKLQPLRSG